MPAVRLLRNFGTIAQFVAGLTLSLGLLLAGLWTPPAAQADALSDGAQGYVRMMLDDGIRSLTPRALSDAERLTRFHHFVSTNVDLEAAAHAVVGRYWERASAADHKQFIELFEQYIILSYVSSLKDYNNESIRILNTESTGRDTAIVHMQILEPGEAPTRLDIEVRQPSPDRYLVGDLVIDGVSILTAKRSEFGAVLRQGGSLATLNDILRKKNASLGGAAR